MKFSDFVAVKYIKIFIYNVFLKRYFYFIWLYFYSLSVTDHINIGILNYDHCFFILKERLLEIKSIECRIL